MSLFKTIITCLCLAVSLSACGFESMYTAQNQGIAQGLKSSIEVDNIPDRDGQYLRNLLVDRLYTAGRPAEPRYQLKFSPLAKEVVNIGVQKDATATRAQMQIVTKMQLVEKNTGTVLLERNLRTVGAHNLLDNQLATLVSQQNITEGILQELSDDIMTELSLYFRRQGLSSS